MLLSDGKGEIMINWGERYEAVKQLSVEALEKMGATNCNNKKSAHDIYTKATEMQPDLTFQIPKNSFNSYLSQISKEENSSIVKELGSHGYYFNQNELLNLGNIIDPAQGNEEVAGDSGEQSEKVKVRNSNEKKLYKLIESWLQSKGFRTKDTSEMKVMGKWGNPDVTGIKVDELLGKHEIEVVTVELKCHNESFNTDFFEAVSHRRFANRTYFGFAAPYKILNQSNDELRYYSELYNVGVIVVAMDEDDFNKYKSGELKEIEEDQIDIHELFTASFEPRQVRWQKKFFQSIGIVDIQSLWKWGTTTPS